MVTISTIPYNYLFLQPITETTGKLKRGGGTAYPQATSKLHPTTPKPTDIKPKSYESFNYKLKSIKQFTKTTNPQTDEY